MTRLGRCLLDAVWPESCAVCGDAEDLLEPGPRVSGLRPWDRPHCCRACLASLGAAGHRRTALDDGTPVVAGVATGPDLVGVVGDLKYRGLRGLAWPLATILLDNAARELAAVGAEAVVPVPLHRRRASSRGFNQAALLAGLVGHGLGLPVLASVLRRRRATPQQAKIAGDDDGRVLNVAGAFASRGEGKGCAALLVDDMVTSGATAVAAAAAMRGAGWRVVGVACVGLAGARLDTVGAAS